MNDPSGTFVATLSDGDDRAVAILCANELAEDNQTILDVLWEKWERTFGAGGD